MPSRRAMLTGISLAVTTTLAGCSDFSSAEDFRIGDVNSTTGEVFADLEIKTVSGDLFSSTLIILQFGLTSNGVTPHDVDLFETTGSSENELKVFLESDFPPNEGKETFEFDVEAPSERARYLLRAYKESGSIADELSFVVERI
ncbi:hypothetical protein [Halomarina rubra]|uniref:Secreted protein n=1 Tax=Halomarina rubra TaxID=2071873 RepID=A0ABD6AX18_9EURY|nr:hypothetical protein [Halomarina rubra]